MNGLKAAVAEFDAMIAGAAAVPPRLICWSAAGTLIAGFAAKRRDPNSHVGARTAMPKASGAQTATSRREMLADARRHSIHVGHSERAPTTVNRRAGARRPKPPGVPGWSPSFVSARPEAARIQADTGYLRRPARRDRCRMAPRRQPGVAMSQSGAIGTGLTPTIGDVEQFIGLSGECSRSI